MNVWNLVGRGEAEGKNVNAVRIKMTSGGNDTYLMSYLTDEDGNFFFDEDTDAYIADSAIAVPGLDYVGDDLHGEPIFVENDDWHAGPAYADISQFTSEQLSSPGVSFAIELGWYDWESDDEIKEWVILASSGTATYEDLENGGYVFGDLSMQGSQHWNGGSYAVPEPTSAILLLIGGGLLSLRRRRVS